MDTICTVAVINADSAHYERFEAFDAVLAGQPDAEVAWLRTRSSGDGVLYAGLFVVRPSTFRYTFSADESVHVIEGEVDVALDGGERVHLAEGDVASFPGGVTSTWTVTRTLRKFFVICG